MEVEWLAFDMQRFGSQFLRLLLALALTLPIGWEREISARSAGLRTFPLVAMASCSYVLISLAFGGAEPEAQSRVLQGLMTGMGFIGGGAILKNRKSVTGTATAASLWATSAIGAAVAYGQMELALSVSLLTLIILRLLHVVERGIARREDENAHDPDES
jgi:putative Mg2+ transporter-C (MgtC) family protein